MRTSFGPKTLHGWLVLLALAVLSAGCSRSQRASAGMAPASEPAAVPVPPPPPESPSPSDATTPLPRGPAFVTTVSAVLAVESVGETIAKVREEVARTGGYVANMTVNGEGKTQRASFSIRVPSANNGALRASLARLGEIKSELEYVEDVGEERADRHARLANARAEEKRLLELLATRTGTLADVLAAERELARVRETVERLDAQAAALEGKIAFATVNLSIVPSASAQSADAGERIAGAIGDGFRYAAIVLVGLAVIAAQVGPTLLAIGILGGAFALVVRAVVRRTRRAPALPVR